jgi:hypothetical protein
MSSRWLAVATLLVCHCADAGADVVTMTDGRVLEGEIVAEQGTTVVLDAKVAPTIRATINLPRAEIKSIERQPLPPGFFDPPPPAARVSKTDDFAPGASLYLEVPIIGRFGTDVHADGVLAAIRYAQRHRIEHVVFPIDSTGGSYEEARAIYEHLRKYSRHLTYHALIHDCLDGALAVAIWCDTVSMVPGAAIGGTARIDGDSAEATVDTVTRAQIAREVAREAERRGRRGVVVRAMIDPLQEVVGWRTADGRVEAAERAPEDLPAKDVIFRVGPKETLNLSYNQALRLGLPPFEGTAADLGDLLEIDGWELESDYGTRVMAETVARKRDEADKTAFAFSERVRKNISQREMAEAYIQDSLRQAAEWNPTNDTYQTYARRWRWGWRDGVSHSSTWTNESRRRWQNRTDATAYFLREAARGIKTLAELESEAKELGLEPMIAPGELQTMARDVQVKSDYLAANRNRRGN